MPKINVTESALHDWVHALTFQQQALLMTGMRGPDGCNKHNPAKAIVRYLRGAICKPAGNWNGTNNNDFMWGDYYGFSDCIRKFFDDPDAYPHHFIMHLVHCAEVIGYKHPDGGVACHWKKFYLKACHSFHMISETMEGMDDRLNDFGVGPASHPAPSIIVGEREERKYPIGGYASGNYSCHCVTCKGSFIGDKRAVQCEPCATKMVEEAAGKDYAHIHVNLPNGAIATVSPDASPELLNALTKMVDLAKAMPDAPAEQALPEEVNIVYDKIFIPTKKEPGLEYPSSVCDFDGDEQKWVRGDGFIKEIPGPVAFMSANMYHRLQAELASARTLILNIKRGNIYQEPADECDKWLHNNPETK